MQKRNLRNKEDIEKEEERGALTIENGQKRNEN